MSNDNIVNFPNKATGISEENLNLLADTLEESKPEEVKNMEKSFEKAIPTDTIEEDIGHITRDTNGNVVPIVSEEESSNSDQFKDTDLSVDEIAEGQLEVKNNDNAKDTVKGLFNAVFDQEDKSEDDNKSSLSDEDAFMLIQTIQEYQRGVKKNYYNSIPDKMKQTVNAMIIGQGQAPTSQVRNSVTKIMLDQFINEINMDQEFIDFETTMKNTLEMPSVPDIYSDYIREMMEENTLAMADRVQEESPEKAELLRKVSAAFTSSYTYDKLIDCLKNNRKARNHIGKDRKNYKKFCKDFNYNSENSKFKINDIFMAGDTLIRMTQNEDDPLWAYEECNVIDFIILICKTCESMDRNDIVDCAFIYHIIKNIIMLDYRSKSLTDFSSILIDNIKSTMNTIMNVKEEHERMVEEDVQSRSKKGNHSNKS